MFTRFEEENGGLLLVATLCLLETSVTGLLETELLQILGDEDNLMPPDTVAESEKGNYDIWYCHHDYIQINLILFKCFLLLQQYTVP